MGRHAATPKVRLLPYFEPNAGQAQAVPHGSYDAVVTRIDNTPLPVSAPLALTDRRIP